MGDRPARQQADPRRPCRRAREVAARHPEQPVRAGLRRRQRLGRLAERRPGHARQPDDEERADADLGRRRSRTRSPSAPAPSGSRTRAREPSAGSRRSATRSSRRSASAAARTGSPSPSARSGSPTTGASHLIRIDPAAQPRREAHLAPEGRLDRARPPTRSGSRARPASIYRVDPASMAVEATVTVGREPARDRLGRRQALGAEHRRQHRLGGRPGDELGRRARMPVGQSPLAVASAAGARLGHVGLRRGSLALRSLTARQSRSAFGSRKPSESSGSAGRPSTFEPGRERHRPADRGGQADPRPAGPQLPARGGAEEEREEEQVGQAELGAAVARRARGT